MGGRGGGRSGGGEAVGVGWGGGGGGGLFRSSGLTWTGNDPFKLDNSVFT